MRNLILLSILSLFGFSLSVSAQSYMHRLDIVLADGDFIFQDLDCPLCEAIESVTTGYNGYSFSHVGLVKRVEDEIYVGEAISSGVQWTPLSTFVSRSVKEGTPQLLVMRLSKDAQNRIPSAIQFIEDKQEAAYDSVYVYGDDRYYCSELLYDAFANGEDPLFSLEPMTFKAKESTNFLPIWKAYYAEMNQDIPEGKPGINPGGISRSPHLQPIFVIGLE